MIYVLVLFIIVEIVAAAYTCWLLIKELKDTKKSLIDCEEKNAFLLNQIKADELQIEKLKHTIHSFDEVKFTTAYKPLVKMEGCFNIPRDFFNREQNDRDLALLECDYMRILHNTFDRCILPYIDFRLEEDLGRTRLIYEINCVQGDVSFNPDSPHPLRNLIYKLKEEQDRKYK